MSSIDERVVEMSFDNKQFEKGVETTIASINELKQNLKFDQAGKGLEALSDGFRSIDTSSFSNALDAINSKFSIFGTFKDQVLRDLVGYVEGKVLGTFNQLKDAMTIGSQVWSGFSEYETKMNAIQVLKSSVIGTGDIGIEITPEVDQAAYDIIYNGLYGIGAERKAAVEAMGLDYTAVQSRVDEIVANNWEWVKSANGVAYTMEDINDTLDTMNEYADKTIYNFPQMTENLGKFTVAGIDLKQAEKSIIGLANLAASAGADATQMSQATYQMSQAMSSGIIRLMDWNSLAQRSMDTAQLKQVILEVAKQQGVASDILNEASTNFRDSLSKNWLTTDIFNEALAVYADAETASKYGFSGVYEMAMEAAQRIRTFTMLKDTITEQIQSGWTESWQYIIGDSEEAAESLTRLNDVIANLLQPTMDARNSMLEFWHDFGGREAVVNGLFNILEAFTKILGTVKTAWREIFPSEGKGGNLVRVSRAFEAFTQKLIMGRDTADKVRRTFKGLFAVFAMAGNIVKSLFRALSPVFDLFKKNDGQKGILDYTASLGDFLVALHEGAVESDIFYNIFSSVVDFLISIPSKIKSAINSLEQYLGVDFSAIFETAYNGVVSFVTNVAEAILGFNEINTSSVGNFASDVKNKLSPLSKIGAVFSFIGTVVTNVFKKIAPVFSAIGTIISDGFSKIKTFLFGKASGITTDDIINLLLGGSLVGLIMSIKGFFDNLKDAGSGISDVVDKFTGVLGAAKEALQALTLDIKANALLKIAFAVGVLAAALWGLSTVDQEKLKMSLGTLTSVFLELIGTLKVLGTSTPAVVASSTALIFIAASILMLVGAVALLNLMDSDSLVKGITALGFIVLFLSESISSLSGEGKNAGSIAASALVIIFLSNAVLKMIGAIAILAKFSLGTLVKGIIAMGAVLLILAETLKGIAKMKSGSAKEIAASALMIITLSNAVIKLTGAIAIMSLMDPEKLLAPFGFVIGLILAMAGAVTLIGKYSESATSIIAAGGAFILIANSMVVMAVAIGILAATLEFADIGDLALITVMFVGLIGVIALLSYVVQNKGGELIALGAALLVISFAMINIASVIALLATLPIESVEMVMGNFIKLFGVIGLGMAVMSKFGANSGLMVGVGAGLILLSVALQQMAKLKPDELSMTVDAVKTLLKALAIFSVVVGIFGDFMPFAESMVVFAIAIAILGSTIVLLIEPLERLGGIKWAALAKAGVALGGLMVIAALGGVLMKLLGPDIELFSLSMLMLTGSVLLLALAFKIFNDTLIAIASADYSNLGENLLEVCDAIIYAAPAIGEAVYSVIDAILYYLTDILGSLFDAITDTIVNAADSIDQIVDAILLVIFAVLKALEGVSYKLGSAIIGILIGVIDGVADRTPELMGSLINLAVQLIDGLAEAIGENSAGLAVAIRKLILSVLVLGVDVILALFGFGEDFLDKVWEGIKYCWDFIAQWWENLPKNIIGRLANVWQDLLDIGGYIIEGFKAGLTGNIQGLFNAFKKIFGAAWDIVANILGIASPSKEFAELGDYTMQGFTEGLEDGSKDTFKEIDGITNGITDSFEDGLDNQLAFSDLIDDPEIKPVLNMDEIKSGLNTADMSLNDIGAQLNFSMNDQLSKQFGDMVGSMNDLGEYNNNLNSMMDEQFGGMNANLETLNNNNAAMGGDIAMVKELLSGLSGKMDNMNITLDTGALVGGLSGGMNDALGKQTAYTGRGMTTTNLSYESALMSARSQTAYKWAGVRGYVPYILE